MPNHMRGAILVCLLFGSMPISAAEKEKDGPEEMEEDKPQLDWDKPIWCVREDEKTSYRVQCDKERDGPVHCLRAPNQLADGGKLQRTQSCTWAFQDHYEQIKDMGGQMEEAIAESPPGWLRDKKGRVFQVTFDLFKRFYVGAAWAPNFDPQGPSATVAQGRFEMGFEASWLEFEERNRHTIRALEGFVAIDNLEVAGSLINYDMSHASTRPLLRITTFFGPPERHDLFMDLGWGTRILNVHLHPHQSQTVEMEIAELHMAWDIWQSPDLYSHVRLETGLGIEGLWGTDELDLTRYSALPNASLKGRFGLGPKGFHYLTGDLHWAMPIILTDDQQDPGDQHTRAGARAGYEVIFLAINDQPLSLRLEAGLDYRDDLPGLDSQWEASATAGLRFSFWVPARIVNPLPVMDRR